MKKSNIYKLNHSKTKLINDQINFETSATSH